MSNERFTKTQEQKQGIVNDLLPILSRMNFLEGVQVLETLQLYQPEITEVLNTLAAEIATELLYPNLETKKMFWLGLFGDSGSGKTTFISQFLLELEVRVKFAVYQLVHNQFEDKEVSNEIQARIVETLIERFNYLYASFSDALKALYDKGEIKRGTEWGHFTPEQFNSAGVLLAKALLESWKQLQKQDEPLVLLGIVDVFALARGIGDRVMAYMVKDWLGKPETIIFGMIADPDVWLRAIEERTILENPDFRGENLRDILVELDAIVHGNVNALPHASANPYAQRLGRGFAVEQMSTLHPSIWEKYTDQPPTAQEIQEMRADINSSAYYKYLPIYMRILINEYWNGKWVAADSPEAASQDPRNLIVREDGAVWVAGQNRVDRSLIIQNRPVRGPIDKYHDLLTEDGIPKNDEHAFPFYAVSLDLIP